MKIERRQDSDWLTVVAASGEVDAYTGPELREALTDTIDGAEGPPWLLADLSEVQYLDSIGLGILVQAAKGAAAGEVLHRRPALIKRGWVFFADYVKGFM